MTLRPVMAAIRDEIVHADLSRLSGTQPARRIPANDTSVRCNRRRIRVFQCFHTKKSNFYINAGFFPKVKLEYKDKGIEDMDGYEGLCSWSS